MRKNIKKKLFSVALGVATVGTIVTTPIVLTSCTTNQTETSKPISNWDKYQTVKYLANIWNTKSAEKNAMSYTAYNSAIASFAALKNQPEHFETDNVKVDASNKVTIQNTTKAIPVVFMDIDETIINNYAFQNYCLLNDVGYSDSLWHKYVIGADKNLQPVLKGAVEFINYVWKNGGVVMFNSNRLQKTELEATKKILIDNGINKEFLPDWVWWMQGIDLNSSQPWSQNNAVDTSVAENKSKKTTKEDRMNYLNEHEFDLSTYYSGANKVQFKTLMRIGDSINDFNDNATDKMTNNERIDFVDKNIKNLFGNFNINTKGVKTVKNKEGAEKYTLTNEAWAECYVMIGGNTAYGAFESGIKDNWFKLSTEEKQQAIEQVLKELYWEPKE